MAKRPIFDTPAPPDLELARGVTEEVNQRVNELVGVAKKRKVEILEQLRVATAELEAARQELANRPTREQLTDAEERARQAQARVDELTGSLDRLQEELSRRPLPPDQMLNLIRQDLEPTFASALVELSE